MMRGVTRPGGTAPGASAAGQELAGKTGTVNDHTDVWFIGYTPTYVTGVWMGNPLRKWNLGNGMTGGHGALPYFNDFMNEFMKDKPKDKFQDPPPVPPEIKSLIERQKREELEKLEKADIEARKSGAIYTPSISSGGGSGGGKRSKKPDLEGGDNTDGTPTSNDGTTVDINPANPPTTNPNPPTTNPNPPPVPTPKKADPPAVKSGDEGSKRKGKKGER